MPVPLLSPAPISPATITPESFNYLLNLYPETVERVYREKQKPSTSKSKKAKKPGQTEEKDLNTKVLEFRSLDDWRYDVIPGILKERKKDGKGGKGGGAGMYLTKEELEKLMDWKLKHGKFRPTLMSLIRSNAAETVEDVTREAYASIPPAEDETFPLETLNHLCTLRGVGPATASLLLSVADEEESVFFGDEVWEWVCGDGGNGKGGIKYTVKEYEALWRGARRVRERVGKDVRMGEVERVGFVIGNLRDEGEEGAEEKKAKRGEKEEGKEEGEGEEVREEEVKERGGRTLGKRKVVKVEEEKDKGSLKKGGKKRRV
ncbi:hypothetical protein FQN54_002097 [Arachnomyces sp. PD_36]|nr:hypothetical protein FQN54_002097 [Arachnomyces sp. PD_36]